MPVAGLGSPAVAAERPLTSAGLPVLPAPARQLRCRCASPPLPLPETCGDRTSAAHASSCPRLIGAEHMFLYTAIRQVYVKETT